MTNCIGIHSNISFIGAGNVAWHLAQALYDAGHHIVQIYSRTKESAEALARLVNAQPITNYAEIEPAHIYIYSLKDDVLQWAANNVKITKGLHIHTSGSIPMSIFKASKTNYGCMYPLQTFTKAKSVDLRKVPFFIEANNDDNEKKINELVRTMSQKTYHLSSEDRQTLHLAGVFACNFTNLMYIKAEKILQSKSLPFEVIKNLITEQVNKAKKIGPKAAQTGPAIRGDRRTIDKQIAMLANEPQWQEVYSLLTELIANEQT